MDQYGNQTSRMGVGGSGSSGGEWIYYKVKSGDSLGKIASRNHVSVKQWQNWYGLRGSTIKVGQRLKVGRKSGGSSASSGKGSSSKGSSASSGSSSGEYTIYTVKSGDSLYKIAKRYGVSTSQIMKANGIGENIRPGMKLKIPKR